jgi:cytochrome c
MPDGTGLPQGEGSVEDGEALYEEKCVMCHGDFGSGGGGYPALSKGDAYELQKTLTNNRWKDPEADGPIRVFGSYWPKASTLFWYIRDAMPHTKSKTLTANETYALVAYILNINEMKIDGKDVDEEYILNREKFLKIKMPNEDGFVPKISGKNGIENVRKFYKNPKNYGAIKIKAQDRCMTNCQKDTAKVVKIKGAGISDFKPPMSIKRDLPTISTDKAHKVTFDAKSAYEQNCTACHGTIAPAVNDKDGWKPILAKGIQEVYKNGLNGTNKGMPARGGSSLSDDEFKKVVDYMIN